MRKIILLLIIVIFSCCSKKTEIESIEIISYYYNLKENQTKFQSEIVTYSIIDENGISQTIQKNPFSKNEYLSFKSTIKETKINEISLINRTRNKVFYRKKQNKSLEQIYCGPINRIKLKYKNNKEITFNYSDYKPSFKYKEVIEIQNLIKKNYSEKKFSIIAYSRELQEKMKDFEKYSMNKDTLEFPFPPMPLPPQNIVRFIK